MIDSFKGKYGFLSTYHRADIAVDGIVYPTVEHAFHASKVQDAAIKQTIAACPTPAEARRQGRKLSVDVPSWEEEKITIMERLNRIKFANHSLLRKHLLDTGYQELVSDDDDHLWGVNEEGEGENRLGLILMDVRDEMRNR